jgi:hypothetical protein
MPDSWISREANLRHARGGTHSADDLKSDNRILAESSHRL